MKRILFVALSCLMVLSACKKNKIVVPDPTPVVLPPNQSAGGLNITSINPTSGLPNTVVTISGSDFGTSASGMRVIFNGVEAPIQSVTPTEVKVLVPVTKTGNVTMVLGNNIASGPTFTYIYPEFNAAYVSGDVTLHNQAEVDLFVRLNKGRQLRITGNLNIGGEVASGPASDITSTDGLSDIVSVSGQLFLFKLDMAQVKFLSKITSVGNIYVYAGNLPTLDFSSLHSFSGSLTIYNLPELTKVDIDLQDRVNNLVISGCPKLADLSFLHNVTFANQLSLSGLAASSILMDRLAMTNGAISISGNASLAKLSLLSLTKASSLTISYSPLLADLNFSALNSIDAKLILRSIGLSDMRAFSSLQNAGALQIIGNPSLANFHGLENLKSLSLPGVSTSGLLGNSVITRANGIYIENNVKLASLNGLQNITAVPLVYIIANPLLSDLCPLKQQLIALGKLPAYTYPYRNQLDRTIIGSLAALTVASSGGYANKQAALDAVLLCK